MSNGRNRCHSSLPESEVSKDTMAQSRDNASLPRRLLSRFLKRIQIIALWAAGILGGLTQLASKLSRSMKKSATVAALVTAAILAGHTVSAQVAQPPPPLSQLVPQPDNIGEYIKDKTAAIALGKSLFWDMQLGSDGIQSCASCHFHAGADNRSKNQINPGQRDNNVFNIPNTPGHPNYQLTAGDYPITSNDVTGSQGVFRSEFIDVARPGRGEDRVTPLKDDVFNVQNVNVRRVTNRNTPTVINAVFNFRNFWDGRAQDVFNGVNPFGARDPDAFVLKATDPKKLEDFPVRLNNSSLASQAVGPPLNSFETAAEDLPIAPALIQLSESNNTISITDKNSGNTVQNTAEQVPQTDAAAEANNQNVSPSVGSSSQDPPPIRRIGRKLGKKLVTRKALAKQDVAADDNVLGSYRASSGKGLNQTYEQLIQAAFQPQWWNSDIVIQVNPNTGERKFLQRRRNIPLNPLLTNVYTLAEYNFSLFFGLAVQAYESTLVSDQTPFDRFLADNNSNSNALTAEQKQGLDVFRGKGGCVGCHGGVGDLLTELTSASVRSVARQGRIKRLPSFLPVGANLPQDTGFFNIGVRPPSEDIGLGGNDGVGDLQKPQAPNKNSPLSEVRLAQQGRFQPIFGQAPPITVEANETIVADGAFKTPGLRNVELTPPYFHNGGQLTLRQVVDFYSRGA
ncbi:MAG TPA: cytochrome C peroxidase, partial [Cyanobacteria bacterium UBA11049]|nr:cytochrome C peroxidase [Cyanobacteria bacterium UBA11049]